MTSRPDAPLPPPVHTRFDAAGYASALILAFLVASLTWNAGFYDDDSVISLWRQQAEQSGFLKFCWINFRDFITYQGRFVPVFSFGLLPLLLSIGDDLTAYRTYFAAIYLVAFVIMQGGLRRLLRSSAAATVVLAAFVANIQLQNYHDSYTSYFAYLPFATALVIGAMASFARMLDAAEAQGRIPTGAVIVHLCWVLAAISTWEVGVVIAATTAVHALLARAAWRQRILYLAIPVTWGALFILANLMLKRASTNTGTVVSVSSVEGIGHAYWVQLVGGMPFALGDAACPAVFSGSPPMWVGTALAAVVFATVLLRTRHQSDSRPSDWMLPASVAAQGACLIFAPPALTAITAKYQAELQPGMAYLQVYVQNVGLAMILGTGFLLIPFRGGSGRLRLPFAIVIIALLTVFIFHSNRNHAVIELRNAFWTEPRKLTATAISNFRTDPSLIGTVLMDRPYLQRWENPDFARRLLGQPLPFTTRSTATLGSPGTNFLYVNYTAPVAPGAPGFAHAGRIDSSTPNTTTLAPTDNVIVVTRPAPHMSSLLLEYTTAVAGTDAQSQSVSVPARTDEDERYFSLKVPEPVQSGSVRIIVRP